MSETLGANSMISHYRIVSKIGVGGMGEVYLAQDTKLTHLRATDTGDGKPTLFSRGATTKDVVLISGFRK